MKKIILTILILVVWLQLNERANAQSTVIGNVSTPPLELIGWNGGAVKPLDIQNVHPAMPINFYLGGALLAPPVAANQYMTILGTGTPSVGFVGIGNNFPTPMSRLHLDDNVVGGNFIYTQWTNTLTGNALPNNGFRVGIDVAGRAQLRQEFSMPMQFIQNSGTFTNVRMQINSGSYLINSGGDPLAATTNNLTRVGIWEHGTIVGLTYQPVSLLQIGAPQPINQFGHRDWMDVGAYTNYNSDNMYVGLKSHEYDVTDAIINWGDNPIDINKGDRLKFIYTLSGVYTPRQAATYEGLEVSRMVSEGNFGRVGIGGDPNVNPYNRCQPNSNGDPSNTLEVNSPDQDDVTTLGGRSGLRFTDLTSSSHPLNNNNVELTVDECGDVYLQWETVGFGQCNHNGGPTTLTDEAAMKLNNWNVYFEAPTTPVNQKNSVGIGYNNCSTTLNAKLDVYNETHSTLNYPYTDLFAGKFLQTGNYSDLNS